MSTNRLYTYYSQVRGKEIGKDKEERRRGIGRGMRRRVMIMRKGKRERRGIWGEERDEEEKRGKKRKTGEEKEEEKVRSKSKRLRARERGEEGEQKEEKEMKRKGGK